MTIEHHYFITSCPTAFSTPEIQKAVEAAINGAEGIATQIKGYSE